MIQQATSRLLREVGLDDDAMHLLHSGQERVQSNLDFLNQALNEGMQRYHQDPVFHAKATLVQRFLGSRPGRNTVTGRHEYDAVAIVLLLERFERALAAGPQHSAPPVGT